MIEQERDKNETLLDVREEKKKKERTKRKTITPTKS